MTWGGGASSSDGTADDVRPLVTRSIRPASVPISTALLLLVLASCTSPKRVDTSLESRIRAIADRDPATTVAVALIDSAGGTTLQIHGDRVFHAASTMKVPVLIEVYRQAEDGRFSLDNVVTVENRFRSIVDGSTFSIETDSDDVLYERLGEEVPIRELVQRMVVVSSNLATNILIELVSADSTQQTVGRLGARTMRVLRGVEDLKAFDAGLNNTATAGDLAMLLDAIRRGEAVSPSADAEMVDILREQEFDSMIPAGLPSSAEAAHKTGWITGIAHDVAIVYPEDAPPYVLVILTEGFESRDAASEVGAEITRIVHGTLRP